MENSGLMMQFEKIEAVQYQHREGGRYAYVQLMAYVRELREHLVGEGIMDSGILQELDHTSGLLNALVALRFDESHRLVFEDRKKMLSELKLRLAGLGAVAA